MEAIFKRRSIRKYTDTQVPDEMIKKILAAAMQAPSAGNQQPWHFIVLKDKKTLVELSGFSTYCKMMKDAPVSILVCGDLSLEAHKGFWVQDCSAAVQNMLLEVAHLGLGAVWLGAYPREDRVAFIQKSLALPVHIIPFAVIPVGYPAQELPASDRYNQSRVHYGKW